MNFLKCCLFACLDPVCRQAG
ncbi:MAG: hypothetical protein ACD_9C00206G0001, partial [uncultured bacterium]